MARISIPPRLQRFGSKCSSRSQRSSPVAAPCCRSPIRRWSLNKPAHVVRACRYNSGMFGREPKNGEKKEEKQGFLKRLRARLNRGNSWLTYDLADLFRGRQIDDEILDELETRLLTAD